MLRRIVALAIVCLPGCIDGSGTESSVSHLDSCFEYWPGRCAVPAAEPTDGTCSVTLRDDRDGTSEVRWQSWRGGRLQSEGTDETTTVKYLYAGDGREWTMREYPGQGRVVRTFGPDQRVASREIWESSANEEHLGSRTLYRHEYGQSGDESRSRTRAWTAVPWNAASLDVYEYGPGERLERWSTDRGADGSIESITAHTYGAEGRLTRTESVGRSAPEAGRDHREFSRLSEAQKVGWIREEATSRAMWIGAVSGVAAWATGAFAATGVGLVLGFAGTGAYHLWSTIGLRWWTVVQLQDGLGGDSTAASSAASAIFLAMSTKQPPQYATLFALGMDGVFTFMFVTLLQAFAEVVAGNLLVSSATAFAVLRVIFAPVAAVMGTIVDGCFMGQFIAEVVPVLKPESRHRLQFSCHY